MLCGGEDNVYLLCNLPELSHLAEHGSEKMVKCVHFIKPINISKDATNLAQLP